MNIEQLTVFFKWMSIINIAFLMFSTFAVIAFKSLMVNMHSGMFGVTKDQIAVTVYAYLGTYKLLSIVLYV